MNFQTTRESHLPNHIWIRLVLFGSILFIMACILAGSVSFVTLRIIQRNATDLLSANMIALFISGVLIGAFQATVGQSLVGKATHMNSARSTAWWLGTVALTLLGVGLSLGPFIFRVNVPILSWAYSNNGFIALIALPALLVGVFQGMLIRNGWRGLLTWLVLVLFSWLLAAKLCEWLFFFLIGI